MGIHEQTGVFLSHEPLDEGSSVSLMIVGSIGGIESAPDSTLAATSRTSISNSSWMPSPVFALVSVYSRPCDRAKVEASSVDTARLGRSILLPTRTMTLSRRVESRIVETKSLMALKVAREETSKMAKTPNAIRR